MRSAVVALVPVKALDKAKSRLGTHLSPVERSALARHMIHDVLSVLSAVPRLVTMVVTSDAVAKQIAAQFDLATITDQGSGLNMYKVSYLNSYFFSNFVSSLLTSKILLSAKILLSPVSAKIINSCDKFPPIGPVSAAIGIAERSSLLNVFKYDK